MNVLHLSAECYPAAKVGGLADVVGSLPRYQSGEGASAAVLIPHYRTPWLREREEVAETVYEGVLPAAGSGVSSEGGVGVDGGGEPEGSGAAERAFAVRRIREPGLGFRLFTVRLEGLFEGEAIYPSDGGGAGKAEHWIAFQRAALEWVRESAPAFDLLHCHDHHTALVPFMMTRCPRYDRLSGVPGILTVHNARYQGRYGWEKTALLPDFDPGESGLLEWGDALNSLAAGLKCAWRITTVSPSYMEELGEESGGLEWLFRSERAKSAGILNGIDTREWDPASDRYIHYHYTPGEVTVGKERNKVFLCRQAGLPAGNPGASMPGTPAPEEASGDGTPGVPLISFIGRLVDQKGADLLPDLIADLVDRDVPVRFLVLGTGDRELHERFAAMNSYYGAEKRAFAAVLDYNESLAHQIYAGSDFLIMPSRVEPCGLNQLYSMRYGTIPIVRSTGGLKDTVVDLSRPGGYGFRFDSFTLEAALEAVERALEVYEDPARMLELRRMVMGKDFSWNASAKEYIDLYKETLAQ